MLKKKNNIVVETPIEQATNIAANALSAFDEAKAGLVEANNILNAVVAFNTAVIDEYTGEINEAQQLMAQNTRVFEKINTLLG